MTNKKQLLSAAAIAIATAALAGCGSTGAADDAVAVVAGTPITKTALRHWTAVELAIHYEANPQKPPPAGIVYEPPDYAPCIAHLRALASAAAERAAKGFTLNVVRNPKGGFSFAQGATKPAKPKPLPTTAQLQRECAENYHSVEEGMLNVLIRFQWRIQEANADKVNPSEAEVRKEYARYSRQHFPNQGEQQRYLADTGASLSDELLRMRTEMIAQRISNKQTRSLGGDTTKAQQLAYYSLTIQKEKQWIAQTSCSASHIIEDCKQYKAT